MGRRLLTWVVGLAIAVGTGCARRAAVDPDAGAAETSMPPSPSPATAPAASHAPESRPAVATRPAAEGVASTRPAPTTGPTTQPADNPEEVRSERRQFTETFEQLELFRREVAELQLDADARREVKSFFDHAAAAWAPVEAELDAGRLPPADRRAALSRLARETESKVKAVLGPERSIQLAAYRQTPHGGGQRFVARLRIALESLHAQRAPLTPEQSPAVESVLEQVSKSVETLPAQEATTFEAEQAVRQRIQGVIEDARGKLAGVLTPAQMADVVRQVPSLAKPAAPATGPTSAPATRTNEG
jgi:hypothetical protein